MTQAQFDQVVCLELDRLAREYEGTDKSDERVHPEQYPLFQSDHKSGVIVLVGAFEKIENAFWEYSRELLDLNQLIVNVRKVRNNVFQLYTAFLSFQFQYIKLI